MTHSASSIGGIAVRRLRSGDEMVLERYLAPRADSGMFLVSNLARGGLDDVGFSFQGVYVGGFTPGGLAGVVCHAGNGMLLVQADAAVDRLAMEAVTTSRRPISGIAGPPVQVQAARRALGLAGEPAKYQASEILFGLDLARLRLPAALADPAVTCRLSSARDLPLLRRWMTEYRHAIHGTPQTGEALASSDAYIRDLQTLGHHWLLEKDGEPVAMTSINAATSGTATMAGRVQIGGVWTPPERRGRDYARLVIAGALLNARHRGLARAVLFTHAENHPAQRAYRALGFEVIGDYGIVLFS